MKNLFGKPARVLLVYPDYTDRDCIERVSGGNYSEGLASISAVLKESGHSVSLLHLLYLHTKNDYQKKLASLAGDTGDTGDTGGFDVVGFSVRTTAFPDAKKYISWTREILPDCVITCGSYHVTLVPEEVLAADGVDAVCIGDGEYAMLDLCDRMRCGEDYTTVESMYFKIPGSAATGGNMQDRLGYSVKKNPVRELFTDLERLPVPDFNLFDYKNLESTKVDTAIVMMSRGCLFSCTYCGNSQFRNVYPNKKHYARFRSPENSILYLKTLLSQYPNIKFINFRDAIFNMYPEWFDSFIEMYKNEINLPFTCNVRFDRLTEDAVRRMKEAGCYTIDVGVESGDYEIRTKYLKRHMTDEQMISACEWFHKYKITTLTYNIVGLPHENLRRALKTVKLNARMRSDRIIPNIFYPYPMTELHAIAKEAGFVPDEIPPDCRVPLKQKQFPEHEVLFCANFFMYYVRRYRRAYSMKRFGGMYEGWLDFWFCGPLTPRRLLVFISDAAAGIKKKLRRFLADNMPGLYLRLRRRVHKKG